MYFTLRTLFVVLFFAATPLVLTGCASTVAETPAQRVYALQSEYAALLAAAVAYESQPRCIPPATSLTMACSQEDWVLEIRTADNDAWAAIKAAQDVVRDPNTTGNISTALSIARSALTVFNQILVNHNLIGAPQTAALPAEYNIIGHHKPPMTDRELIRRTLPHHILFPNAGVPL